MDRIEPGELYDERGEVSLLRPWLQGDVFEGIVLPGFDEKPRLVQVVDHPCSMRRGAALAARLTVAPVEPVQPIQDWEGNLRQMPLPELRNSGYFATQFPSVTSVRIEVLHGGTRIATLSNRGIYVLQQRLIRHYTRLQVDLPSLHRQSAPTLTEAELQVTWLETVLGADEDDPAALEAEREAFERWLRSGEPSRQELLQQEHNFVDVRRAAQRAAQARARELERTESPKAPDERRPTEPAPGPLSSPPATL